MGLVLGTGIALVTNVQQLITHWKEILSGWQVRPCLETAATVRCLLVPVRNQRVLLSLLSQTCVCLCGRTSLSSVCSHCLPAITSQVYRKTLNLVRAGLSNVCAHKHGEMTVGPLMGKSARYCGPIKPWDWCTLEDTHQNFIAFCHADVDFRAGQPTG